jgi:monothiol glutaredoxin
MSNPDFRPHPGRHRRNNPVVLFMKGTPVFPQCGFSARVVQVLSRLGLHQVQGREHPRGSGELRRQWHLKEFSDWPTFPQLYVKGEFVGGCDIVKEMYQNGELQHFGPLVRQSLAPFFDHGFHTEGAQSGIPPDQALPRSFTERQEWLIGVLEGCADPGRLILMGRSSGARIASTLADLRPVRGLVCLGYPFRQPGRPDDPSRYTHLPHLRTPTLIIQGSRDPYGGDDVPRLYPLAPRTELVILDTDHGFRMEAAGWERVGREILLFLGHCCPIPE